MTSQLRKRSRGSRGYSVGRLTRPSSFPTTSESESGDDGAGAWSADDEWRVWSEEFALGPTDPFSEAFAADPAWTQYVANLIASAYLADIASGRKPMANGKYKPRLDDQERDRLVERYYGEIVAGGSR
jgi:hypothetical protein